VESRGHTPRQFELRGALVAAVERLKPLAETSRDLVLQADQLYKLATRLIECCEDDLAARDSDAWGNLAAVRARKAADAARHEAVAQLKLVRYLHRQAHWLTERFPEGVLRDVPGLVKVVDRAGIAAADRSLTPCRYVGVAPADVDEDVDSEQIMCDIHTELADLNREVAGWRLGSSRGSGT